MKDRFFARLAIGLAIVLVVFLFRVAGHQQFRPKRSF